MRFVTPTLLLLGLVIVIQAQQPSASDATGVALPPSPTDVMILKCSWARERIPGWEKSVYGPPEPFDIMIARIQNERQMQQARNAGDKSSVSRTEGSAKQIERATLNAADKDAEKRSDPPRFGYRYKVLVRNSGAKAIKAIDWDYILYDPDTQNEIARHQFASEEKISPGKEKELSVFILSPPTRTVASDQHNNKDGNQFTEHAIIVRIEYSDGSTWQQQ